MSLTSQLKNLNDKQLKSMCDTMLNASIAFENGGNYREIFRRAKQGRVGLVQRIYESLEQAEPNEIEALSNSLAEGRQGWSVGTTHEAAFMHDKEKLSPLNPMKIEFGQMPYKYLEPFELGIDLIFNALFSLYYMSYGA